MINKFQKIINNKFSGIFKFIFFLRYVFLIFFVAILLFLIIPQFFNYQKKELIIENYVYLNYGLQIKKIENIKYKFFPIPKLEITNINSDFYSKGTNLKTKKLIIYPKLTSIYNYSNFEARKIVLENNDLKINLKNLQHLSKKIFFLKKKLFIKNLNLNIKEKNNTILNIKKINFLNYGYKKNIVRGEIFKKNFNIKLDENFKNINFELLKTGVSAKIKIIERDKLNKIKGNLKGKILKSNFKSDFIFDGKKIEFENFYFRDKKLSLNSNGIFEFEPFFNVKLNTKINHIYTNILKNFEIQRLLQYRDVIKKLNNETNLTFKSRKFSRNLIDEIDIKTSLAYGRINLSKNFLISKTLFQCNGNMNLLEEYPVYYFNCKIDSPNKKKFLSRFNIDYKEKNEDFNFNVVGDLNILNNKINFYSLETRENYKASKDDLLYFKTTFENILFDENFAKIFNLLKIKKFLKEIL